MLVGQRDHEPVELLGLELLAKGFEAIGVLTSFNPLVLNSLGPQLVRCGAIC